MVMKARLSEAWGSEMIWMPFVRHEITVGHADDVLAFRTALVRQWPDAGASGSGRDSGYRAVAHHTQVLPRASLNDTLAPL